MLLHEVKPGSHIRIAVEGEPVNETVYRLEKIDGAYSRCWDRDRLVHLSANAPVEVIE
ncbi:unnamed protein product [marine sediment metagenome]|uniref:Uncharacterized protein n=1 Tax=marine sediment metagenome TaxID=412755 RepID=X0RPP2_9ZZZZ